MIDKGEVAGPRVLERSDTGNACLRISASLAADRLRNFMEREFH